MSRHFPIPVCLIARLAVDQEIARPPVERRVELRVGKARAFDHRLVIAGEQAPALAAAGDRYDAHSMKLLDSERAS